MGSACCGDAQDGGGTAANRGPANSSAANKYKLPPPNTKPAAAPPKTSAAGTPEFQEETRARARDRAAHALLECIEGSETVIPSLKWRRQHLKSPGMGTYIAGVLGRYLAQCNERRASVTARGTQGGNAGGGGARGGAAARPGAARGRGGEREDNVPADGAHSIVTLDFRGMRIGDEGLAALAPALLADNRINNVLLAHNDLTDKSVEILEEAVRTVRGTASTSSSGGGGLADTVPSAIELLILADNPIGSAGLTRLAKGVLPFMFHLDRVEVGEGQMGVLSPASPAKSGVAQGFYDEEGELLSDATVKALIEYIRQSPSLSTFVFKGSGNYDTKTGFSPQGLQVFVQQVVGRSKLAELYLQECYTTKPTASAGAVGPFVPQRKLKDRTNPANDEAARAEQEQQQQKEQKARDALLHTLLVPIHSLSEALCTSTTALVTLVLRIPLSDEAMVVLSRGLSSSPRLENLSLRGCDLSANGIQSVAQALERNKSIAMLDISFQSNLIAHPAVLAEMRSSSKRRQSVTNVAALNSSAEARRLDDFGESVPTRDQREHPLLPIIKALHTNRTLARLVMLGINIGISDLEELCSCIEVSHNRVLCEVAYTNIGVEALNTKLETFLSANSTYGSGSVMRQSVVSPSATYANSARYRSVSANSVVGAADTAYGDGSLSESMRNSISLSDAFGTYGGPLRAASPMAGQASTAALPRPRSTSRASSPSASLPSLGMAAAHRPPLIPRPSDAGASTDDAPYDLMRTGTKPTFDEHYEAFRSTDRTGDDDNLQVSRDTEESGPDSAQPPHDLSTTGRLY